MSPWVTSSCIDEAKRWPSLVVVFVVLLLGGCRRKHVPVDAVADLPYPSCESVDSGEDTLVSSGRLRGSPNAMAESAAVESFEVRRRACLTVATVRQEWSRGATDVEVVFDENRVPLRAWRRMTLPGSTRSDGNADIRRYELRTPTVTIKKRSAGGPVEFELLRGARPTAVIGPGRGLLTVWIQKANLEVGEKTREPVLDFREMVEVLRDVTLKRENDRLDPTLNRSVRVYTIYGREAVFTDDQNVVVGDLAGMRPSAAIASPEPAPAPTFGIPDPVNTP